MKYLLLVVLGACGASVESNVDQLCDVAVECTADDLEPTTHEQCVLGWFLDQPEPCAAERDAYVQCLTDNVVDCATWESWQTDGDWPNCLTELTAYVDCG